MLAAGPKIDCVDRICRRRSSHVIECSSDVTESGDVFDRAKHVQSEPFSRFNSSSDWCKKSQEEPSGCCPRKDLPAKNGPIKAITSSSAPNSNWQAGRAA